MPYFTTDELRALPDMGDSDRFPDDRLEAAHDWIVAIIERECETSFIAREVTETVTGTGTTGLALTANYVLSVDAVTVNDVAVTSPATTLLARNGSLYYRNGTTWPATPLGNVVVTYTAGYSTEPPADLKEAAMRAARNWLLTTDAWSGKDTRATSITNDYGNINLAVAGPDRPTGLPDVDATIMAWKRITAVAETAGSVGSVRSVRLVNYGAS